MQATSSYGVEIRKQNIPIRHTLRIYRSAVSYLIQVYTEAWGELSEISNAKKRFNEAEHLVHGTKKNQARYDFDLHFPKLPSYLRRSVTLDVVPMLTGLALCQKRNNLPRGLARSIAEVPASLVGFYLVRCQ